jgi:hypothetical protein
MCRASATAIERIESGIADLVGWVELQPAAQLGQVITKNRELINRLEAATAIAIRRFEKAGGYKADGALGMVPWMRAHTRLSGGAAAEQVETARQLAELPRTEEALARGEIAYDHAVTMARAAEHVGAAKVRKAENMLLKAAESMDAGQFVGVAKNFEHQVDAESALSEANRAHERRYVQIGEPSNGLVRIDGQLTTEAGAILKTALEPFAKPSKRDERTSGQRMADALVELCTRGAHGSTALNGGGPKPLLIVKVAADTLAGIEGAPAAELEWGGTIPAETARRLACDSALSRFTGLRELECETTHAARTVPASIRRALVARDGHCVFPGCDRPPPWCSGHHLVFWSEGGPTKLENLGLVCGTHHRKVHEEGWTLKRKDGRWQSIPPMRRVGPAVRSNR